MFYFFFLYWSPSSSLCTVLDAILSNIDEVLLINLSTNMFVFGDFNVHHNDLLTYSGRTDRPVELSWNNLVVVSISIDIPLNSKQNSPFHRIAYDYFCDDWDGLCDHLRDVPYSLFHIKITASVTKSSYQDCGPCYLHLSIFFLNMHSPVLWLLFFSGNETIDHCSIVYYRTILVWKLVSRWITNATHCL